MTLIELSVCFTFLNIPNLFCAFEFLLYDRYRRNLFMEYPITLKHTAFHCIKFRQRTRELHSVLILVDIMVKRAMFWVYLSTNV